jgi:hypothetical protein
MQGYYSDPKKSELVSKILDGEVSLTPEEQNYAEDHFIYMEQIMEPDRAILTHRSKVSNFARGLGKFVMVCIGPGTLKEPVYELVSDHPEGFLLPTPYGIRVPVVYSKNKGNIDGTTQGLVAVGMSNMERDENVASDNESGSATDSPRERLLAERGGQSTEPLPSTGDGTVDALLEEMRKLPPALSEISTAINDLRARRRKAGCAWALCCHE